MPRLERYASVFIIVIALIVDRNIMFVRGLQNLRYKLSSCQCIVRNRRFAAAKKLRNTPESSREYDSITKQVLTVSERAAKVAEKGADWDKWTYGTFAISPTSPYNDPVDDGLQSGNQKQSASSSKSGSHVGFDPLWSCLSEDELQKAVSILTPYVTDERQQKFEKVLSTRTQSVRFVFENPSNANNVWAALRTLDSFGLQFTDMIFNDESYICQWRKGTMGAALGSQKWMTMFQHADTNKCLLGLKEQGYTIIASDLQAESLQSDKINWKSLLSKSSSNSISPRVDDDLKVAIVMGNESDGISPAARQLADHLLYIPMRGFAESLNLSVAVAVLCAQLDNQSMLRADLPEMWKQRILMTWLARTVRSSETHLKRAGIEVPYTSMYERIGGFSTKP